MKTRVPKELEDGRVINGSGATVPEDGMQGSFWLQSPVDAAPLFVISSDGIGWDHVSVSRNDRCPTWEEMEFVKRLFFRACEVAMELHVAEDKHISVHPHCLHLWRPQVTRIPLPPRLAV